MRALITAMLLLAVVTPSSAQKRCKKGIPCGNSCISATKTCRIGTPKQTPSSSNERAAADVQVSVPEGAQYVASTRGRTYYWIGCKGWKSLSKANLRFFKTVEEAKAAGLRPSRQAGCAGP